MKRRLIKVLAGSSINIAAVLLVYWILSGSKTIKHDLLVSLVIWQNISNKTTFSDYIRKKLHHRYLPGT